jgi:hypothetical protein
MIQILNKSDIKTLKHLTSYRYLSIVCIIVNLIGTTYGIYYLLFTNNTYEAIHLNNVRLNASIIMLGLSCLMYKLIKLIEKFKLYYNKELEETRREQTPTLDKSP